MNVCLFLFFFISAGVNCGWGHGVHIASHSGMTKDEMCIPLSVCHVVNESMKK